MAEEVVASLPIHSTSSLPPYVHAAPSSSSPPLESPIRSPFNHSSDMYTSNISAHSSSRPSGSSYPSNGVISTNTSNVNVISSERRETLIPNNSTNSPPSGDALTNNLERMKITIGMYYLFSSHPSIHLLLHTSHTLPFA
jgi:hypothetical protein